MDPKNLVGKKIDGKYEVSRIIGAGGMGAVYEAHHVGTRRRVAIKVISTGDLSKDEQLVGRFQNEAKAAGAVDTQHICQVLDTGTDPETNWPFMVMEFMSGEDVQQLLRRVGPIHQDLALRIAAQACIGLSKAHGARVVHRDMKPANLYLARTDAGKVLVKLLDFGIAKVKMEHASEMGDAGLTRTGTMLGSPLYMSPEQARGVKTIDHRADIWSLGIVLYEMLSGRTPYHHIDALGELIIAICSEPPRPIQDFAPWISAEVAAIVHKALKAQPNDRFQTAAEMLDAIKALQTDGFEIDESMLVSLSETQRNLVAKRLSMPPPPTMEVHATNVAAQSVPPPALTQAGGGTTGGLAAPTERNPQLKRKSSAGLVVAGAALSIAVFGGVAYKMFGAPETPVQTAQAAPQPIETITGDPADDRARGHASADAVGGRHAVWHRHRRKDPDGAAGDPPRGRRGQPRRQARQDEEGRARDHGGARRRAQGEAQGRQRRDRGGRRREQRRRAPAEARAQAEAGWRRAPHRLCRSDRDDQARPEVRREVRIAAGAQLVTRARPLPCRGRSEVERGQFPSSRQVSERSRHASTRRASGSPSRLPIANTVTT